MIIKQKKNIPFRLILVLSNPLEIKKILEEKKLENETTIQGYLKKK